METQNEENKKLIFINELKEEEFNISDNIVNNLSNIGCFTFNFLAGDSINNLKIIADNRIGLKELSNQECIDLISYNTSLRHFIKRNEVDEEMVFLLDEKELMLFVLSALGLDKKQIKFINDDQKINEDFKKVVR